MIPGHRGPIYQASRYATDITGACDNDETAGSIDRRMISLRIFYQLI